MDVADPPTNPGGNDSVPSLPVAFKRKRPQGKAKFRERPATTDRTSTYSSESSSSDDENSAASSRLKRRQQGGARAATGSITASSKNSGNKQDTNRRYTEALPTTFQADRAAPLSTTTNDATKHSDWFDHDQTNTVKKGPTRKSTNVRTITTTDYAADVCKDYKKTGWCGFGDACIFLHDRGDTKRGWEQDLDWEKGLKANKTLRGTVVASAARKPMEEEEEDDQANSEDESNALPSACGICEKAFKSPVVTQCGHYFCEACALKRYRKDPSCKSCGASTNGVFNSAPRLERLLRQQRGRLDKNRDVSPT